MEAAVPHNQHFGRDRPQHTMPADTFTGVNRPEASIDNHMGTAFGQVNTLCLWQSGLAPVGVMTAKDGRIGCCIRQVIRLSHQ